MLGNDVQEYYCSPAIDPEDKAFLERYVAVSSQHPVAMLGKMRLHETMELDPKDLYFIVQGNRPTTSISEFGQEYTLLQQLYLERIGQIHQFADSYIKSISRKPRPQEEQPKPSECIIQ